MNSAGSQNVAMPVEAVEHDEQPPACGAAAQESYP